MTASKVPIHAGTNAKGQNSKGNGPDAASDWLVSVRNRQEMILAMQHGVDIIDFKEPDRGPLAPADTELWHWAAGKWAAGNGAAGNGATGNGAAGRRESGPTVRWSAALGESDEARTIAASVPPEFHFAKVGPSGQDHPQKLAELWHDIQSRLPKTTGLVAVAYADADDAQTIRPEAVFDLAAERGLTHALVDTFTKDGRTSIDVLGWDRLHALGRLAAERGLWWALAGSVRSEHIRQATQHGVRPNCWGVRGDVCDGPRTAAMCANKLMHWRDTVTAADQELLGPSQTG